jgi:hypothetical protein
LPRSWASERIELRLVSSFRTIAGERPSWRSRLTELGFVWNARDLRWENMFTELKLYVAKFNDCNVPATWEENPKLGKWVRINARRSEAGDYRQSARLVSMLLDSSGSAELLA